MENPLVRRVKKHAQMTAIFRAVSPETYPSASVQPGGQVYRAIVLPPQGIQAEAPPVDPVAAYFGSPTAVAPTAQQPAIQRQPTPIVTPEIAPTVNQPAASTAVAPPLLQRQPAAAPTPAPAKPAITPTPATAATPTTAQPAAPVTVEEKEDLRLSAIMRLHEEKASREAETAAPAPTTPPVQRQPATRPTPTSKAPETRQQPPVLAPPPRRPRPSLPGETAVSEQPIQRQPETTANITPSPEPTSTPAIQPEITPTESMATTAVEPAAPSPIVQRQADETLVSPATPAAIQTKQTNETPPIAASPSTPPTVPAKEEGPTAVATNTTPKAEEPAATTTSSSSTPAAVQAKEATPTASAQPAASVPTAPAPAEAGESSPEPAAAEGNIWQTIGRSARRLTQGLLGQREETVQRTAAEPDASPAAQPPHDEPILAAQPMTETAVPTPPPPIQRQPEPITPPSSPTTTSTDLPTSGESLADYGAATETTPRRAAVPPTISQAVPITPATASPPPTPAVQRQSVPESVTSAAPMPEATTSYSEPTAVTPVSASSNQSSVTSEEPTVTAVQRKNEAPLEVAAEETQIWQPKAQESTPIQASPLQTVWPVQRVDTPPMAKPTAVAPAAPPIMRQPAPEVIQAKEQLAAVPTVMPSDSSVAMMAPRRPRPTALAKETAVTTPSTQPTATTETTIPTPPIPTIQRQPEAVPTEIGELPSDLWQLIGQEPPHTAPTKVAPPTKPANGNGTAVVQREAATQSPPTETSPNTEAPDTTLEAAAGPEGGDEEKKTEEEIDIDELARQVYSELKYQLSIEWERIRGRHELNNW